MDLQNNLIESKKQKTGRNGWKATVGSLAMHLMLVGAVVYAGTQTTHKVDAEDQKIPAFITQGAAPPPPPPPPPPPKAASSSPQPRVQPRPVIRPVEVPVFSQPREIPKEVPKVDPIPVKTDVEPILDLTPDPQPPTTGGDGSAEAGAVEGGVVGGVAGGQVGGVVGGQVGGVVGGELGGQVGGVVGGKLGGEVGGTGTGTEGTGSGGNDAPVEKAPEPPPPPPPAGPLRVGGDVKAPVTVSRTEPQYTEPARSARLSGIVIVEAIIDKNGNVDAVRVVKDLPMGLGDSAARAVRSWKFKPGTLNGKPVATIFNLTVNFTLN